MFDLSDLRPIRTQHTSHEPPPCSVAAVRNHPGCMRAARVARTLPVAMRAPLPRSARNGDEREDARQERRPATGQENQGGRASAKKPLLDCDGDEPPVMRSRPRASREGRPVAIRAPLPRSAPDDRREDARQERRPATEAESTLYLDAARSSERADACGARAPREGCAARGSARASVSSRPSRSVDTAPHEDGKKSLRACLSKLQCDGRRRERCGGSERRVSGAWEARTVHTIGSSKQARERWVGASA